MKEPQRVLYTATNLCVQANHKFPIHIHVLCHKSWFLGKIFCHFHCGMSTICTHFFLMTSHVRALHIKTQIRNLIVTVICPLRTQKKKLFTWCTLVSVSYDDNFKVFFLVACFFVKCLCQSFAFFVDVQSSLFDWGEYEDSYRITRQMKWSEANIFFFVANSFMFSEAECWKGLSCIAKLTTPLSFEVQLSMEKQKKRF